MKKYGRNKNKKTNKGGTGDRGREKEEKRWKMTNNLRKRRNLL
jgi:hypothetical protein